MVKLVADGKGKAFPGSVTCYEGETVLGTVTLTTPTAVLRTTFPAGSHTLTAVYDGSATLQPSPPSSSVTLTIT